MKLRLLVITCVVALATCGTDRGDEDATTAPPTTTTAVTTTTSTTPSETMPPDHWVGITDDGRLVTVETVSGERTALLGEFDDPDGCPDSGEPAAGCQWVNSVTVSPDRTFAYYETCCEPAPGTIYRVPVDGGDAEMVTLGAFPALDRTGTRLAVVESQWLTVHDLADRRPDRRFESSAEPPSAVRGLDWSSTGNRLAFTSFTDTDRPGTLHVIDITAADNLDDATAIEHDDAEVSWTLPAFRHDGVVAVVEQLLQPPESPAGPARLLFVDPDTSEIIESSALDRAVLSQRFDSSRRHLIQVGTDGSVAWRGPDGNVHLLADSGFTGAGW